MDVRYSNGPTQYGPGVDICLDSNELATAIDAYLVSHGIHVSGPRSILLNGTICREFDVCVYVDPSGFVISDGEKFDGRGP